MYINWKDTSVQGKYKDVLNELISRYVPPAEDSDTQQYVDEYYNGIVSVFHEAAQSAMKDVNKQKKCDKRRHYWWNFSCTEAKNRNKFWFRLWCSLDRPRDGVVYRCYKHSKYQFRKVCRTAVNEALNCNFKKCSIYFRDRRMSAFWNRIRK
jgi:hypothetical protein